MKKIKLNVLEYLKFERDERIPELIEMYDGDDKISFVYSVIFKNRKL